MKNLSVSVCVQAYNQNRYIESCLDGILMQQTTFPFEIILGEDESDDGTRELCTAYAKKHPDKIKLFLRSRKDVIYINESPTGRYNFIENLKACQGKYIALCDGDDYWTDPLKLQKQVDFLEGNKAYNICFHKVKMYDQSNQQLIADTITKEVNETTSIEELAKGNFIHTPSVMVRNNFVLPKWFKKSPVGDWTLYMLAIKNKKIKKLDEVMAVYRVHDSSIWSGLSQEVKGNKTRISINLVYKNVALPKKAKQILRSRLGLPKKKKSILLRIINKIKKELK